MEYNYNHYPCHSSSFKTNSSSKAVGQGTKKSGGRGTSSTMKLSTDPQSVAARERRHRISDRFKILKGMVPGGTKMDTVSMLDEAIQYVKFLKAQIWLHRKMMVNSGADNDPAASSVVGLHLPPPQPPSADVTSFSFRPSQYEQYYPAAYNDADDDNNLLPPLPPQQPPFIPVPEYSSFHAPDVTGYCYNAYTINDDN